MNEHLPPKERESTQEPPRLDIVRLSQLVLNYTGGLYDNLETRKAITRNTFESLIDEIHTLHPTLMRRCLDLSRNIDFGLGGNGGKKST